MLTNYRQALEDPDLSLSDMCNVIVKPLKLYKYQSFGLFKDNKYIEKPFWSDNMKGVFHLSLGCEFEDRNDCRPYINKNKVILKISDFFQKMETDSQTIDQIMKGLDESINDKILGEITSNYQHKISIGCFTEKVDNIHMWNLYADSAKGFCIEYNTSDNQLFYNSMLPILYSDKPYDSTYNMVLGLILTATQQGKGRTLEQSIPIYDKLFRRILKTSYVPLFYKSLKYRDEEEWRMFLLDHRTYMGRTLNKADFTNSSNNINLNKAISAIYLGKDFALNPKFEEKLSLINEIVDEKKINLYQMEMVNGKLIPKPMN